MPIYEYTCNKCGEKFEFLYRNGDEPECPGCKSNDLDKHISTFSSNPERQQSDGCGCTPKPRAMG